MIGNLLTIFLIDNDFTDWIRGYELTYDGYELYFKDMFEIYGDNKKEEHYKKEFGE